MSYSPSQTLDSTDPLQARIRLDRSSRLSLTLFPSLLHQWSGGACNLCTWETKGSVNNMGFWATFNHMLRSWKKATLTHTWPGVSLPGIWEFLAEVLAGAIWSQVLWRSLEKAREWRAAGFQVARGLLSFLDLEFPLLVGCYGEIQSSE